MGCYCTLQYCTVQLLVVVVRSCTSAAHVCTRAVRVGGWGEKLIQWRGRLCVHTVATRHALTGVKVWLRLGGAMPCCVTGKCRPQVTCRDRCVWSGWWCAAPAPAFAFACGAWRDSAGKVVVVGAVRCGVEARPGRAGRVGRNQCSKLIDLILVGSLTLTLMLMLS